MAKHLKEGRLKDAIALSSSKNYRYSHLAKVVLAGLQEYQFQQESGGGLSREDLMDTVRRSIQRASALTASDLKKGVSALATIGSTAPFVGLLGTVVGVINAFQGIGASGSGGIGAVSVGISEALVETALGLVVAIPAVWFYNYLTGPHRVLQRRDGQLVVGAGRLLHQEDGVSWRGSSGSLVGIRRSCSAGVRFGPGSSSVRESLPCQWIVGGAKGGVKADINVTPLVDVMLVLLIIMMLVAPHAAAGRQRQAAARRPIPTDKPETQEQTVVAIAAEQVDLPERQADSARPSSRPRSARFSRARPRRSSSSRPTRTSTTAP